MAAAGAAAAPLCSAMLLLAGVALLAPRAAGQGGGPQLLTDQPNCRLPGAPADGVLPAGAREGAGARDRGSAPRALARRTAARRRAPPCRPSAPSLRARAPAGISPYDDSAPGGAGAGGTGSCAVVLPQLARGEVAAYEFGVAPGAEMTLMLVMRTRGGSVDM